MRHIPYRFPQVDVPLRITTGEAMKTQPQTELLWLKMSFILGWSNSSKMVKNMRFLGKKKFSIDSQKKSIPYTVWLFKVANWKITILDR